MRTLITSAGIVVLLVLPPALDAQSTRTIKGRFEKFDAEKKTIWVNSRGRVFSYRLSNDALGVAEELDFKKGERIILSVSRNSFRVLEITAFDRMQEEQRQEEAAATERAIAAYDAYPELWRSRFIARWKKALASAKKTGIGLEIRELLENDPPYFGTLPEWMDRWSVGQSGTYKNRHETVAQVIDKNTLLVFSKGEGRPIESGDRVADIIERSKPRAKAAWVMFKGFDTTGITDGKILSSLSESVVVTGTTTYKTAGGGTNTVLVVEPVSSLKKKGADPSNDQISQDARAAASLFVGRWRIVDSKGTTAAYFTLTEAFKAKKSHAPKAPGTWEIVNGEVRITWSDGFRDAMKKEGGNIVMTTRPPGTDWDDPPSDNVYTAVKEPKR